MIGISGLVITQKREELFSFMASFDWVSFGLVTEHIGGGSKVLNSLLFAFIICLFFKNSLEIAMKKQFKTYQAIFVATTLLTFHFMMREFNESPFLYFNF
jgi:hypothetical protein